MKRFFTVLWIMIGVLAAAGIIGGAWYAGVTARFGEQYIDISELWFLKDIPGNIDGNLHLNGIFDTSRLLSLQYPGDWSMERTGQGVRFSVPGTDAFINIGMFKKGETYTDVNVICEDAKIQMNNLGGAMLVNETIAVKSYAGVDASGCLMESSYPFGGRIRRNLVIAIPDNTETQYYLVAQLDAIEGDFAEHQLTFQRMINTIRFKNIMQPNFKLNFDLRRNKTE